MIRKKNKSIYQLVWILHCFALIIATYSLNLPPPSSSPFGTLLVCTYYHAIRTDTQKQATDLVLQDFHSNKSRHPFSILTTRRKNQAKFAFLLFPLNQLQICHYFIIPFAKRPLFTIDKPCYSESSSYFLGQQLKCLSYSLRKISSMSLDPDS